MQQVRLKQEQIVRLIKEVESHRCLWDKENVSFNEIYHVGRSWKLIARRLMLTEKAVKLKWKNIRDTFNRIITKNPNCLLNYTGKWPFFKELHFLSSQIKNLQNDRIGQAFENFEEYRVKEVNEKTTKECKKDSQSSDYDLLFLESLVPYFVELEPVRRAAMKCKIQEMIMEELIAQNDEESCYETLSERSSNESE